jgi:hypothetical protein
MLAVCVFVYVGWVFSCLHVSAADSSSLSDMPFIIIIID